MKAKIIFTLIIGILIGSGIGYYIGNNPTLRTTSNKELHNKSSEENNMLDAKIQTSEIEVAKNMEGETSSIKVYFSTLKDNEGFLDCGKTEEVTRLIPKTEALAEAALNQLFLGPTEEEKVEGHTEFWINKDLSHNLKRIFIKNHTAYLDWKDFRQTIGNASTSCGSQSFYAPIDATLKQFPSITNIVHAIDGKPAIFYDWMQVGCDLPMHDGNYCDDTPYK